MTKRIALSGKVLAFLLLLFFGFLSISFSKISRAELTFANGFSGASIPPFSKDVLAVERGEVDGATYFVLTSAERAALCMREVDPRESWIQKRARRVCKAKGMSVLVAYEVAELDETVLGQGYTYRGWVQGPFELKKASEAKAHLYCHPPCCKDPHGCICSKCSFWGAGAGGPVGGAAGFGISKVLCLPPLFATGVGGFTGLAVGCVLPYACNDCCDKCYDRMCHDDGCCGDRSLSFDDHESPSVPHLVLNQVWCNDGAGIERLRMRTSAE